MTHPVTWPDEREPKPAPGSLARVQALVNTVDLSGGTDRLADPATARPWLVANELLGASGRLAAADLELVREVREALRALLVANAGGPAPTAAELAPLRAVAERGAARAEIDDDGSVRLVRADDSVRGRLVGVLLAIRDAQRDGTWGRLKACANAECRWAFYDRSRNRGGSWCDMASCGNRMKNRDFRARRRGRAGGAG